MKKVQISSTGLSFTTASLILSLNLSVAVVFNLCSNLSASANPSVKITQNRRQNGLVSLKTKVLDSNNIPIEGLEKGNFTIQSTNINLGSESSHSPSTISNLRLLPPKQAQNSDPIVLIVLLDMSGSMANPDSKGIKKIDGALSAIQEFVNLLKKQKNPTQIAVVPFGEAPQNPRCNYPVDNKIINTNLVQLNDPKGEQKLQERINRLADRKSFPVCAATDLYTPLIAAVKYLGDPNNYLQTNSAISSSNNEDLPPRLSVILLSDGYHNHNDRRTEPQDFDRLKNVLTHHPQVSINTLGYGKTLKQLCDQAINCSLREDQLTDPKSVDIMSKFKLQDGKDIKEAIVDQPRLSEIARLNSGISQFPQDAEEAAKSLETFFKTLREYEIQYSQPGAKKGDKYQVQVTVNAPNRQLKNVPSNPAEVTIPVLGSLRLPLFPDRLLILVGTLGALGGTVWGFSRWSNAIKKDADRWLKL